MGKRIGLGYETRCEFSSSSSSSIFTPRMLSPSLVAPSPSQFSLEDHPPLPTSFLLEDSPLDLATPTQLMPSLRFHQILMCPIRSFRCLILSRPIKKAPIFSLFGDVLMSMPFSSLPRIYLLDLKKGDSN